MPVRYNLSDIDDPHDAVHRAVHGLVAGGLVLLEVAEARWVAALAVSTTAAQRFFRLNETSPAALMFLDDAAAEDVIRFLGCRSRRLLRGGWGPVLLQYPVAQIDENLLLELPEPTRRLVNRAGQIGIAPPSGDATRHILRLLPGPLLVCPAESTAASENVYDVCIMDSSAGPPPPLSVFEMNGDRWRLSVPGSFTTADVTRIMSEQIVFVCTGNTCRSPMAEAMFRVMLAERLGCQADELTERGYRVVSAGLAAMSGAPASPEAVQVCAEQGVDLHAHASQPLTQGLLEETDRLYTMTAGHRDAILSQYPHMADRVQLLSRVGEDVTDPIGWGRAAYDQCYAEIAEYLRGLVDELTTSQP